jgi:hypothetical protein
MQFRPTNIFIGGKKSIEMSIKDFFPLKLAILLMIECHEKSVTVHADGRTKVLCLPFGGFQ